MAANSKHARDEGEVGGGRDQKKPRNQLNGGSTAVKKKANHSRDESLNGKGLAKKDKKRRKFEDRDEREKTSKGELTRQAEKSRKPSSDDTPTTFPASTKNANKREEIKYHEEHIAKDNAILDEPHSVLGVDGAATARRASLPVVSNHNGKVHDLDPYIQSTLLDAVPQDEIQSFLSAQGIGIFETSGSPISKDTRRPILKFDYLPASKLLSQNPFASFTAPTAIQAASWPWALSGRDIIGIAETGSGKTLAFALPCLEVLGRSRQGQMATKKRAVYARAVIVSPTRELAMQTHATVSRLASLVRLTTTCVYGGASKDDQRNLLQRNGGADIIVATPGRLKDFLGDGTVSLSSAKFVVLDEADRMLDKGFEEDIKMILGCCPPRQERQTLMFTATWPASVRGLAETFMVNPVKITVGGKSRVAGGDQNGHADSNGIVELQANNRIVQKVEVIDPYGKEQRLFQLLKDAQQGKAKNDRILVFCLYKKEAVRVEQFLQRKGVRVASIHGDLKQEQRTRSLEAFKAGKTSVLVATDVAARGLDIPEVKLVINVTFPLTIEDYVHRIGRTGRAGKLGNAITLFTEHDKVHSGSLINVLKASNQHVPEELLKFGTTVKKKSHDSYGAFYKDIDMTKKATKITFD